MNMISKPSFQFSHFSNYLFLTLEHIDLSQVKNRNPYILVPSECLVFSSKQSCLSLSLSLSLYLFLSTIAGCCGKSGKKTLGHYANKVSNKNEQ